ncbi:CD63 antigen-like [Teleopsis dalmanni]|uniref:CD63 antigen-like n=1 Tax=Teleopsis dalmanni TaxID=139649 RepID=UPI0018CDF434|nr:CD63 antigen-like [Teleopsis dalmanni]
MAGGCVNFITCFCSLLFALTGLIVFLVGAMVQLNYWHYSNFVSDHTLSAPTIFMIVGSAIAFVYCLGCWGTITDNDCIVFCFVILAVNVFLLEIGIGIFVYVKHDNLPNTMETQFNLTMNDYNERKDYQDAWALLQTELRCCGTLNSSDWEPIFKNNTLPTSCCEIIILNEAKECTTVHANEEGCLPKLLDILDSKTFILASALAAVPIVQILTIILACCFGKS